MSDLFAFDTAATQPIDEEARAHSIDSLSELDAPASRGFFRGTGMGIMRGGARSVQALGLAGGALYSNAEFASPEAVPLDTFTKHSKVGPELTDEYFHSLDEHVTDAVDYWTPTPQEVGKVGQILGGLGEMVLPLAASGGDPALLIASQELGHSADLTRTGVDSSAAIASGLIAGTTTALGLKVPILGSTLTSRLATGAAGNVALGLGARGAESALLSDRPDLAPKVLDMTSLTTDALTGLLFGGLHHTLAPRIDPRLAPSEVDAVLSARNARSFQTETTPGTPKTVMGEVGHQEALAEALRQVSEGQPVDVSDVITRHPSELETNGHIDESVQLAEQVAAVEPKDVPRAAEPVESGSTATGEPDELQMRANREAWAKELPELSSEVYARLEAVSPADLGAEEKGQLQELRRRVLEEGQTPEEAVRGVWGPELADASPRLRQAFGGGVDVPGVSSAAPQSGEGGPTVVSKLPLADALTAKPEEPHEVPELDALQKMADVTPDAPVYMSHDEEGAPVRSTLADAAEQIQKEHQDDLNFAQAYQAAVACFLGHGA